MRRSAGIAIVEADDAIAACRQCRAERRGPADTLRAQPSDQQNRFARGVAKFVIGDADSVGVGDAVVGVPLNRAAPENPFRDARA